MPVEKWSDLIHVVHLADDPQFSEDLDSIELTGPKGCHAILDFAAVHFVNSSNIATLLRVRRLFVSQDRRLLLCNLSNQVWTALLVTGLDKLFEFSDNVPTGLALLQMMNTKKHAK